MAYHTCQRGRAIAVLLPALALLVAGQAVAADDARAALHHADDHVVLTLHAEGAQIYECRADAGGVREWAFKAPEAELFLAGERVGRHFAGPSWEYRDGSRITGKPVAKANSARAADIPWLRLAVTGHEGAGVLGDVTAVLRTETEGGLLSGPCDAAGEVRREPYAADYAFIVAP